MRNFAQQVLDGGFRPGKDAWQMELRYQAQIRRMLLALIAWNEGLRAAMKEAKK
jgi:hypothetical protein